MTAVVPPAAVGYAGFAIGLRADHCREQAAQFRSLAKREPLAQMRRFLTRLAGEYDELAAAQALRGQRAGNREPEREKPDHEERTMPFKPNYRFERIERERLKKAKKEEKLRRQQERSSQGADQADPTDNTEAARPES